MLLSVLTLCLVSFFMLWIGDFINGQGLAITRYMAREQAPMIAHFYPDTHRKQITVILYDDGFLEDQVDAWPVSYGTHARWLQRLVEDPGGRPKAIFMDITFGQTRSDPSLSKLVDTLCTIREQHGIPIFLAAFPSSTTGALEIRHELMSARTANGAACATLAGIAESADPIDGIAWSYPLNWHIAGGGLRAGPAAHGEPGFASAAHLLAVDVANTKGQTIDLGADTAPTALVWSPSIALADPPTYWQHCSHSEPLWRLMLPYTIRKMADVGPGQMACPTHPTLSMQQVNQLEPEALAPYLNDTYLFIGARVTGYDDFAMSPVQGQIPGTYVHAMALDNLLVYGSAYKQDAAWRFPPSPALLAAGLVVILAVYFAHAVLWHLRNALSGRWGRLMGWAGLAGLAGSPIAVSPPRSLPVRLLLLAIRFIAWAGRVWLQLLIALGMILLIQAWFRIGMIPLVELIGMTLLAEGLGFLTAIRRFLAVGQAL